MKRFLLTCDPGLEDFVCSELSESGLTAGKYESYSGRVTAMAEAYDAFAGLRSVHHIHEIKFETELPEPSPENAARICLEQEWPELSKGATFRASCERKGSHDFDSQDVERAVGGALDAAYPARVKLKGWDYEIRADINGHFLRIGIRHTEYSLHRRYAKPFAHFAPLKSTVAFAMLRMADPAPDDRLLDPFCGGGTLLLEAATILPESITILGSDLNPICVAGCKENIKANGLTKRVTVQKTDARELEMQYSDINQIISNLPYGQRILRRDQMRALYGSFLDSAQRVLKPGGKLTLITEKGGLLVHIAQSRQSLRLTAQRNIRSGRLKLYIVQFTFQPQ